MEGLDEGWSATACGTAGFGVPAQVVRSLEHVPRCGWGILLYRCLRHRGGRMRRRAKGAIMTLEGVVVLMYRDEAKSAQ